MKLVGKDQNNQALKKNKEENQGIMAAAKTKLTPMMQQCSSPMARTAQI
jgi:hypothetical protein